MHKQLNGILIWISARRVWLFVLIIAILLRLLTVVFITRQNTQLEKQFADQVEQVQLKEAFERLNSSFSDAESSIRDYAIHSDKTLLDYYAPAMDSVVALRNRFNALAKTELTEAEKTAFTKYDEWLTEDLVVLQN